MCPNKVKIIAQASRFNLNFGNCKIIQSTLRSHMRLRIENYMSRTKQNALNIFWYTQWI